MAKLVLADVQNLANPQALTTINNNSALTEAALENTLSRDGSSPNQMEADLDMNSNHIYNLPSPVLDTEPVRKGDFDDALEALVVGEISENAIDDAVSEFLLDEGTFPMYPLKADGVANVPADAEFFTTAGTVSVGDSESIGLYKNIVSAPSIITSKYVQSANGDWYELKKDVWAPQFFGVVSDNAVNDDTVGMQAMAEAWSYDPHPIIFGPKVYNISDTLHFLNTTFEVYGASGPQIGPYFIGHGGGGLDTTSRSYVIARDSMAGPMFNFRGVPEVSIPGTGGPNVTTTYFEGGGVDDMMFHGSGGGVVCNGFESVGWKGARFRNVTWTRMPGTGFVAATDLDWGPIPTTLNVSNITNANPAVVTTATNHGFTNGITVTLNGVVGMTEVNGNSYTVAGVTATTFQLSGVDSSAFGVYVSDANDTVSRDEPDAANVDSSANYDLNFFNCEFLRNTGYGYIDTNFTASPHARFEGCIVKLNWGGGVKCISGQWRMRSTAIAYNGLRETGGSPAYEANPSAANGLEIGGDYPVTPQFCEFETIEFDRNKTLNAYVASGQDIYFNKSRHIHGHLGGSLGPIVPTQNFISINDGGFGVNNITGEGNFLRFDSIAGPLTFSSFNVQNQSSAHNIRFIDNTIQDQSAGTTPLIAGSGFTASNANLVRNYYVTDHVGNIIVPGKPPYYISATRTTDLNCSSNTLIPFATEDTVWDAIYGSHTPAIYNGSGTFTAPVAGRYRIQATLRFIDVPTTTTITGSILAGGVSYHRSAFGRGEATDYVEIALDETVQLAATNTVACFATMSTGTEVLSGSTRPSTLFITLIP